MSLRNTFKAAQSSDPIPNDFLKERNLNESSSTNEKGKSYVWAPIGKFYIIDLFLHFVQEEIIKRKR